MKNDIKILCYIFVLRVFIRAFLWTEKIFEEMYELTQYESALISYYGSLYGAEPWPRLFYKIMLAISKANKEVVQFAKKRKAYNYDAADRALEKSVDRFMRFKEELERKYDYV